MLVAGTRNGKTKYDKVDDTDVVICALMCTSPVYWLHAPAMACRLCVLLLLLLLLLRDGWA
jgi:hypothetical protein